MLNRQGSITLTNAERNDVDGIMAGLEHGDAAVCEIAARCIEELHRLGVRDRMREAVQRLRAAASRWPGANAIADEISRALDGEELRVDLPWLREPFIAERLDVALNALADPRVLVRSEVCGWICSGERIDGEARSKVCARLRELLRDPDVASAARKALYLDLRAHRYIDLDGVQRFSVREE